ncbi:hypothetical protein AZI11_13275 (plasmid) [Levilactobacillus brevis]|uniref:hypothetical protein n=1 Tax=Levilactobacillus brevis TaxID=1580 RepID=UPI000A207940|nr:hypothetical protein [Levilactobacillus brevis]ARN93903.1 hypothetical protein AZI11_13275 [Levilactobacillus brevis]ARN96440.1 hypothetical protein AZI12_13150 [Levilactobacillus brevis]
MKKAFLESTKEKLSYRPNKLTDLNQWLFVTINTAKSMIDKSQFSYLKMFVHCDTTSDIQQLFDKIQGKFGQNSFSQRHSSRYLYLCSLVANFPQINLSSEDKQLIRYFITSDTYLLYEI